MTINPNLLAGLSNSRTQTQTQIGTSNPYPIGNPTSIQDAILSSIESQSVKSFTFPPDLPKYHFVLIENSWTTGTALTGRLTPRKTFKLQLPTPLTDGFEVNYDPNFSYLNVLRDAAGNVLRDAAGKVAGGAGQALAQGVGAALGLTLNRFKQVTLSSPSFRSFSFTWKFSPKNFKEAQEIRKITFALRKGMAPKRESATDSKLVLQFPYIYTMYFSPNYQYLYKMKPCVLQAINIDYQGGNPFPGFYRAQTSGIERESPPESVVMQTQWLELEFWLDSENPSVSDYKHDGNYIPTANPFDGWNFYARPDAPPSEGPLQGPNPNEPFERPLVK